MIVSKLTSKAQPTIPEAVRSALQIGPGDEVVYSIVGDQVTLSKRVTTMVKDPFGPFEEWDSEADRIAFAEL